MSMTVSPALPVARRIVDLLADGKARTPQEIAQALVDHAGDYIALRDRTREVSKTIPELRQSESIRRLQYPISTDPGQRPLYVERYVLWDAFAPVCLACWRDQWSATADPPQVTGWPVELCAMCGKRTHDGAYAARPEIEERTRSKERRRIPVEAAADTDRESGLRDLLERYLQEDPLRSPERGEISEEDLASDSRRMANDLAGVYQEAFETELSELQRLRETEKSLVQKLDQLRTKYDADIASWRADKDRLSDFVEGHGLEPEGERDGYRWNLGDVLTGGTFVTGCAADNCPRPNEPHRHFCAQHRGVLLDYTMLDRQAEGVVNALENMGSRMKMDTDMGLYDAILRLRAARKTT